MSTVWCDKGQLECGSTVWCDDGHLSVWSIFISRPYLFLNFLLIRTLYILDIQCSVWLFFESSISTKIIFFSTVKQEDFIMFYIFIHPKLKWVGHKLSKLMKPSPYTVTIAEYQYRLSLILTKMTYCSKIFLLGVRS